MKSCPVASPRFFERLNELWRVVVLLRLQKREGVTLMFKIETSLDKPIKAVCTCTPKLCRTA